MEKEEVRTLEAPGSVLGNRAPLSRIWIQIQLHVNWHMFQRRIVTHVCLCIKITSVREHLLRFFTDPWLGLERERGVRRTTTASVVPGESIYEAIRMVKPATHHPHGMKRKNRRRHYAKGVAPR